jgi:hypothetical protein
MMQGKDESVIRKCLKVFVAIAYAGVSINSSITTIDLQNFKDE